MSDQGNFNLLVEGHPDPIVRAAAEWPAYKAAHPNGINLTIGVVADPGTMGVYQPPVMERAYRTAFEQTMQDQAHGYANAAGDLDFLTNFGAFAFGSEQYTAQAHDMLAYQTLGGTGALWMTKELLRELIRRDEAGRVPLLLDPGYVNHQHIFGAEEFNVATYQHADPATGAYNHHAALEAIAAMPAHTVLLLQVCGHNDDGADRTKTQWDEVLDAAQAREAVIVLDGAYLGLARGLADDIYPLAACAQRGLFTLACLSASKIMGVYGERLGALYVLNARRHLGDAQANNIDTTYRGNVRQTITGVPRLVARAGALALRDPEFLPQLSATRRRIRDNRIAFSVGAGSAAMGAATGWGLFTRMRAEGFTPDQHTALLSRDLYVLDFSRLNFAGMRDIEQAAWIGQVVADVLSNGNAA